MTTATELLRDYIHAVSDPTRGAILMELAHAGELTPTQLGRRLGLSANNVYHHMRVLRKLDVVDAPRIAPRETYVEKYYRLTPDLQAMVSSDPEWLDRIQQELTAEDRKQLFIGMCLTMAQLLQRAARRYAAMDTQAFDTLTHQRMLGMLSISEMRMERLESRLKALREALRQEHEAGLTDDEPVDGAMREPPYHVALMAGLPFLWGDEDDSASVKSDARQAPTP